VRYSNLESVPDVRNLRMTKKHTTGTWAEFEGWIRQTMRGSFRWKIRPWGNSPICERVVDVNKDAIKRNRGASPESNAFNERIRQ